VEKEQVIQTLEKRLRAVQEIGTPLEHVEVALRGSKLEYGPTADGRIDQMLAWSAQRQGGAAPMQPSYCNGLDQEVDASYAVAPLREELQLAHARCAELASESARREAEASDLRQEVASLRARLATAEAEVAVHGQLRREVEAQRTSLTNAVAEASVLRSKLASRDADIVRLERSLAELEGWAPHLQGRKVDDSLRLPLKIVDDGYRHVLRGNALNGPATSVVSTATGCEGLSTASSRGQYSSSAPGGVIYGTCDKSPKAAAHSTGQGHTWAIQTSAVRGSSSDGNAILAMAVSNRTRSPVRPPHRLATSPLPVAVVGTPPAPAVTNQPSCRQYSSGDPPARWSELPRTPPHAVVAESGRTTSTIVHRSQSVPVPMRHASASPAPTRQGGHQQVSLASWAASPGSSRRSEGSMDWIPIQRATSQPPPPVAQVVGHALA